MIHSINTELKLVIAGNHDLDLDTNYCKTNSDHVDFTEHKKVLDLWTSAETTQKGIFLLQEGTHTFTLKNGSTFSMFVSSQTPKFGSSAFQYPSNEDRWNPPETTESPVTNVSTESSIIPNGVDIVMTHGPPHYILDRGKESDVNAGCEYLWNAIKRVQPRLHCFGHIHGGYGHQRVLWTDLNADELTDDETSLAIAPTSRINRRSEQGRQVTDGKLDLILDFISSGTAKKQGYAELDGARKLDTKYKQTLFVNAALADGGTFRRPPWLISLDLKKDVSSYQSLSQEPTSTWLKRKPSVELSNGLKRAC